MAIALIGNGIENSRKGNYNYRNRIRLKNVKTLNILCFQSLNLEPKMGRLGSGPHLQFVECRQVG